MKILVDENIPNVTVESLRRLGHDVRDIRATPLKGMDDDALWNLAQADARILVTTDKGFSEHRHEHHHGLLIVRLRQPNEERIHRRVMTAIAQFRDSDWPGMLVVMQDVAQSVSTAQ